MDSCFCDFDQAAVYRAVRPIARKDHRCSECYRTIRPGERYERVDGLWDGEWSRYKTCCYCLAIRDLMTVSSCCFCWQHEAMLEDVGYELDANGYKMPGLRMAIGRLMVESRRTAKALSRS